MKDAQTPDHLSLRSIVDNLRVGAYVVPDFQRPFEWTPLDIKELMRSIFSDYFIGSLLLWKGKRENRDALSCESLYGFDGEPKPSHIVLDGQQRLTALYYAIIAPKIPLPDKKSRFLYFIQIDRFIHGDYDGAFTYSWTQPSDSESLDVNDYYREHRFPLAVIGRGTRDLVKWIQGYEDYWQDKADSLKSEGDKETAESATVFSRNASTFEDNILATLDKYQVSFIELDQDLELNKICDIFTQINHRGVRLSNFDLMNAMLKPKGVQLKHLWREAQQQFNFDGFDRMNMYTLQVMSILRQELGKPKDVFNLLPGQTKATRMADGSFKPRVLVKDSEDFRCLWDRALHAIDTSISILINPRNYGYGAVTHQYLPYSSILPVFAALQESVRERFSQHQEEADRKIWKWYWASIFTNRYSDSVESKYIQDFRDVNAWIESGSDSNTPRVIHEFDDRVASLKLHGETNPNSAVFRAVFNLIFIQGARDWDAGGFSKNSSIHMHYIIPTKWELQMEPNERSLLKSVLNRMPLTVQTSKEFVGDRMPNDYLRELLEERDDIDIRAILERHCITENAFEALVREPFTKDDFREFLLIRSRTIKEKIRGLIEEYPTTSSQLQICEKRRKLKDRVENVELKLRDLIDSSFHGNIDVLPSFVRVRIEDNIDDKKKSNPAFARTFKRTLGNYLKESNFSDLEKIITSRQRWTFFEKPFKKKERSEVLMRLSAVRKLRNWTHHASNADEVTLLEGEGGLVWIESILELEGNG